MEYKVISPSTGENGIYNNDRIASFLEQHLDKYGDRKDDILKCINYIFKPDRGGQIVLAIEDGEIIGAAITNETGMAGYIPENILVYIAVHNEHRGRGLGKQLMQKVVDETEGNIALHVEPDNPACNLYRKMGFTNKYLEMRLNR